MHQQSRHPPRVSSPASTPQTNPTRSNNPREGLGGHLRTASEAIRQEMTGPAEYQEGAPLGPTKESVKKLDQIIQNFYYKAAVVILQSRIKTTPSGGSRRPEGRKTNKWFQLETDDIDDFREDLRIWRTCGSFENRPPPMVIETYLDVSRLSPSQTLVILDENGKRWDVLEALNTSESSSDSNSPRHSRQNTEVILERWRVELKCIPDTNVDDFGAILPTVYKKSIVFFRSLFVATHLLPAWKFSQQAMTKGTQPSLEVKCRVLAGDPENHRYDPLHQPLFDRQDVVMDYVFGDLEVPIGRFLASMSYRNDCNFRVEDSESLLSSRFMGVDENFFKPSIAQRRDPGRRDSYTETLPSRRHGRDAHDQQQQTYGSMSTFHGGGPVGTSPISALKAVRPAGSDSTSPTGSMPASVGPDPPNSLPIRASSSASRGSLRHAETHSRRPSVTFHPFKAGSLSGSPRIPDEAPSSPQSIQRPSGLSALAQARNRNSLTAGMAASLRGGPPPPSEPRVAGSPKPSRYSSSFTHRRNRPSSGGTSRGLDDDQISSGKQSLSSSLAQPGSGLLTEAGGAASSGSFQTDDDNISVFLKAIESQKTLQSFEPGKKGESAAKRTAAQLSKFQLMRESNNALTESMTSSMHLHRSSSSSSRQLPNVPGMVGGGSISSSPGKPLSPHTPHTPAIPSRLSENSIIDYPAQAQGVRRRVRTAPDLSAADEGGSGAGTPVTQGGATAIDIPLSPRLPHTNRRASSVAQQQRAMVEDDDAEMPFAGIRSISLGADERENPTASTLLGISRESEEDATRGLQPAADIRASPAPASSSSADKGNPPGALLASSPYRLRYVSGSSSSRWRGGGRPTPPQSGRGSFVGSGRYDPARGGAGADNEADDEPLVFDLSELGREMGRRSLEEGQSGGSAARSASAEGAGFEPKGTSRRGW